MIEETTLMPSPPYRQGTRLSRTEFALVFNSGGIGDYINWVPAIKYVIDQNPHTHGRILAPGFFVELARLWLSGYSDRFEVHESAELKDDEYLKRTPAIIPNKEQYANACGFNLFALGFVYYAQISWIPKGYDVLPTIKGDEANVNHLIPPGEYVVLTPLATADNRRIGPSVINGLITHIKRRGLTPLLLGKKELAHDYHASGGDGITTDGVIDLRDKTSLTEAACVLARARAVVGLDNGLLHLASCSEVPVLSIFTTVDPALRLAPRRNGAQTKVIIPPEELTCRFCNTNMRYIGHNFAHCLYKGKNENQCVTGLKADNITEFLDELLNERP